MRSQQKYPLFVQIFTGRLVLIKKTWFDPITLLSCLLGQFQGYKTCRSGAIKGIVEDRGYCNATVLIECFTTLTRSTSVMPPIMTDRQPLQLYPEGTSIPIKWYPVAAQHPTFNNPLTFIPNATLLSYQWPNLPTRRTL